MSVLLFLALFFVVWWFCNYRISTNRVITSLEKENYQLREQNTAYRNFHGLNSRRKDDPPLKPKSGLSTLPHGETNPAKAVCDDCC